MHRTPPKNESVGLGVYQKPWNIYTESQQVGFYPNTNLSF